MAYCRYSAFAHGLVVSAIRVGIGVGCTLGICLPDIAKAADVAPPAARVQPLKTYSAVLFGGFDIRTHSYYGYAGGVVALNGNIATDGFLLRGLVLYNPYDYTSTVVAGGVVDGKMTSANAMIGYQKYLQGFVARFYAGAEYEGHRLSPSNPLDSNEGDHYGVHLRGDLETAYLSPVYGSLLASYGSATQRWWVRGRGGYNFNGFIIGPEGILTGNRVTNEQRVGGFVTLRSLAPFELSVAGGYSHTDDTRGGASAYGTLELSIAF